MTTTVHVRRARPRRAQPRLQTELSQRRRVHGRLTQSVHTGVRLDSLLQVLGRVRRVLALLALTSSQTEHVGRARRVLTHGTRMVRTV